jgi:hypothetical protein
MFNTPTMGDNAFFRAIAASICGPWGNIVGSFAGGGSGYLARVFSYYRGLSSVTSSATAFWATDGIVAIPQYGYTNIPLWENSGRGWGQLAPTKNHKSSWSGVAEGMTSYGFIERIIEHIMDQGVGYSWDSTIKSGFYNYPVLLTLGRGLLNEIRQSPLVGITTGYPTTLSQHTYVRSGSGGGAGGYVVYGYSGVSVSDIRGNGEAVFTNVQTTADVLISQID